MDIDLRPLERHEDRTRNGPIIRRSDCQVAKDGEDLRCRSPRPRQGHTRLAVLRTRARTESIVTPPVSQPSPFASIGESRRDLVGPGRVA